jgi:hypothetical protein
MFKSATMLTTGFASFLLQHNVKATDAWTICINLYGLIGPLQSIMNGLLTPANFRTVHLYALGVA